MFLIRKPAKAKPPEIISTNLTKTSLTKKPHIRCHRLSTADLVHEQSTYTEHTVGVLLVNDAESEFDVSIMYNKPDYPPVIVLNSNRGEYLLDVMNKFNHHLQCTLLPGRVEDQQIVQQTGFFSWLWVDDSKDTGKLKSAIFDSQNQLQCMGDNKASFQEVFRILSDTKDYTVSSDLPLTVPCPLKSIFPTRKKS